MIKKKRKSRWTKSRLVRLGIPAVLIPGILLVISLGWNPKILSTVKNYYAIKSIFPSTGVVLSVSDGDTFFLRNGRLVRLIGVNAPDRGDEGYKESQQRLDDFIREERVYLEYDRYEDDKYGRILAWVWIGCEKTPTFLPADYMHLSGTRSREELKENPEGCKRGTLVNEWMVMGGWAKAVGFEDRGDLKYEARLMEK